MGLGVGDIVGPFLGVGKALLVAFSSSTAKPSIPPRLFKVRSRTVPKWDLPVAVRGASARVCWGSVHTRLFSELGMERWHWSSVFSGYNIASVCHN